MPVLARLTGTDRGGYNQGDLQVRSSRGYRDHGRGSLAHRSGQLDLDRLRLHIMPSYLSLLAQLAQSLPPAKE